MKYFKNETEIRAIEAGQENLIQADWVEITLDEIAELNKPTPEQELQAKINEAKAYLASTDCKMTVDYFGTLLKEVQDALVLKRAEAREFIRTNTEGDK